jgi:hypothetical protein
MVAAVEKVVGAAAAVIGPMAGSGSGGLEGAEPVAQAEKGQSKASGAQVPDCQLQERLQQ